MKVLYEWGRRVLRRIELFTGEDLRKKPAIPEASSRRERLKQATDKAGERRRTILNKWKRNV